MIRKFAIIIITTLALTSNLQAGTDGELLLKKNDPTEVKECFEKLNKIWSSLYPCISYMNLT